MPGITKPSALTTKQAKAAYKARGRPTLSEKDARQLERALELERRKEAKDEAERRKKETAKKRAEKEKPDESDRLGTQRRKDRFGFKASQFHLGAFFEKKADGGRRVEEMEEEEDVFGDEELDDEVLLSALEEPAAAVMASGRARVSQHPMFDSVLMPPPPAPRSSTFQRSKTESAADVGEDLDSDLDSFWDDLESSTQIARELNTVPALEPRPQNIGSDSFSSGDFDLTAEDLDELDPPKPPTAAPQAVAQKAMPPPALSSHSTRNTVPKPIPRLHNRSPANMAVKEATSAQKPNSMPPPPLTKRSTPKPVSPSLSRPSPNVVKQQNAIRGPFLPASSLYCSPDLGFTLSQLESFVDDDIQLTQAVPG